MRGDEELIQKIANLELDILKCNIEGFGEYLGESDRGVHYKDDKTLVDYLTEDVDITKLDLSGMLYGFGEGGLSSGLYVGNYIAPKGSWDVNRAIYALNRNALAKSTGWCAKYVRIAIEAGGIMTIGRPGYGGAYGTYLPTIGFGHLCHLSNGRDDVFTENYAEPGDIVVILPFKGHKYGHIAMYNGKQWISDFKQNSLWCYNNSQYGGACDIFRFGYSGKCVQLN